MLQSLYTVDFKKGFIYLLKKFHTRELVIFL
jgi:hypothetical protein